MLIKAQQVRSVFLGNVSHELRTPLNGILALSDMLLGDLDPHIAQLHTSTLLDIFSSGQCLLGLLSNVSNFLALSSSSLVSRFVNVDLRGCVCAMMNGIDTSCDTSFVFCSVSVDNHVPPIVSVDPVLLIVLLQHLVENAIKVSLSGSEVVCRVTTVPGQSSEVSHGRMTRLRFEVEDWCPTGFPEMPQLVTDGYGQANESLSRELQGLGLGLQSVRQLLKAFARSSFGVTAKKVGSIVWVEFEAFAKFRISSNRPSSDPDTMGTFNEAPATSEPVHHTTPLFSPESHSNRSVFNQSKQDTVLTAGECYLSRLLTSVVHFDSFSQPTTSTELFESWSNVKGVVDELCYARVDSPFTSKSRAPFLRALKTTIDTNWCVAAFVGFPPRQQTSLSQVMKELGCIVNELNALEELDLWITSLSSSAQVPLVFVGELVNPNIKQSIDAAIAKHGNCAVGRSGNAMRSTHIRTGHDELGLYLKSMAEQLMSLNPHARIIRAVRRHSKPFVAMMSLAPDAFPHDSNWVWMLGVDPANSHPGVLVSSHVCLEPLLLPILADLWATIALTHSLPSLPTAPHRTQSRFAGFPLSLGHDDPSLLWRRRSIATIPTSTQTLFTSNQSPQATRSNSHPVNFGLKKQSNKPNTTHPSETTTDTAPPHSQCSNDSGSPQDFLTQHHPTQIPPPFLVPPSPPSPPHAPASPPPPSSPPPPPSPSSDFTLPPPPPMVSAPSSSISSNSLSLLPTACPPLQLPRMPTLAPQRALVVEDTLVNARLLVRLLEKAGLKVAHALHGGEAVDMYEKAWKLGAPYQLVLMDCQMPVMDGFEATRLIRAFEQRDGGQSTHAVICAVTAGAEDATPGHCHAVGMNLYLEKPVTRKAIDSVLSLSRTYPEGMVVVRPD
eukprot:c11358_g1_i2.p1 GENE.c11358_g1_i2~~c11358_g1_i2.p1  ORF type:complete len:892 (+),score=197.99 c11358_g1_i2:418-3093(+)